MTGAECQMLNVLRRTGWARAGYLGSEMWGGNPRYKARPAVRILNRLVVKGWVEVERRQWGRYYHALPERSTKND
jgi:hypothetical protein